VLLITPISQPPTVLPRINITNMAQGNTKGLKAKSGSGGRKKAGVMSKGRREIAPKKKDHVREKMTKKVGTAMGGAVDRVMARLGREVRASC